MRRSRASDLSRASEELPRLVAAAFFVRQQVLAARRRLSRVAGLSMAVWSAIRLQQHRERLALNELVRAGYETYCPRILRRTRSRTGKKVETFPLLFPGYVFVLIVLQWHTARFAPGVVGFIMDGIKPARASDNVIAELRSRERGGLVVLPEKPQLDPRAGFRINDRLRIKEGAFRGLFGLYAGMAPRDHIKVLMDILGGKQEVEMPFGNVSRV